MRRKFRVLWEHMLGGAPSPGSGGTPHLQSINTSETDLTLGEDTSNEALPSFRRGSRARSRSKLQEAKGGLGEQMSFGYSYNSWGADSDERNLSQRSLDELNLTTLPPSPKEASSLVDKTLNGDDDDNSNDVEERLVMPDKDMSEDTDVDEVSFASEQELQAQQEKSSESSYATLTFGSELMVFAPPQRRFLFIFPERWERWLAPFDDFLIEYCQKPRGLFFTYLSLLITAMTTIEISIAVPMVLYVAGWDGLGTEFTWLALMTTLTSQIPKRFLWRFRPYMVGRAELRRKDETSSFPSRAVTCGLVYGYGICYAYLYHNHTLNIRWWMPLLVLALILLSSFARINLGVHYPSDCVGGILQGVIICLLGTLLWQADLVGCASCRNNSCYGEGDKRIMWDTMGRANWWVFALTAFGLILLIFASIVKPIEFWVKCDRVFGMLFPCILFQITFLCPGAHNGHSALPPPHWPPDWYSYLYGIAFALLFTGLGVLNGGRWPYLSACFFFASNFAAILWWRLFIT
jgi:membrane-associated phospholipid phosphatase